MDLYEWKISNGITAEIIFDDKSHSIGLPWSWVVAFERIIELETIKVVMVGCFQDMRKNIWASKPLESMPDEIHDHIKQHLDLLGFNKSDQEAFKWPTKADGFYKIKGSTYQPDYHGLARYMAKEILLKSKEKSNYIYNGEYYEYIDKIGIENKVYEVTKNRATPGHIGNFVKLSRTVSYYPGEFINPPGFLNMKNGIIDTQKLEILPHDKNKFFTYKLQYDMAEEDQPTPVFDAFLKLISTNDEQKETLIKEFIGYILSGCDYSKFNKILVLDGDGANGKTSLINIIQALVGQDNMASIDLTSLKENRFSTSGLVGKLVNFCAEEPKSAFSASGILKKLTGNDPVMAEPKNKDAFSFVNYSKFIISYNEMPFLPDKTSGMERRLIIVPCVTDLETNPELKIKHLQPKIQKELGGIARQCIKSFNGVKERGHFTVIESGKARYKELVLQSDPFLDFMNQHVRAWVEMSEEDRELISKVDPFFKPEVSSETLWEEFDKFMNGKHTFRKRGFETKLGVYFKKLPGVKKVEKSRPRIWQNAVLIN